MRRARATTREDSRAVIQLSPYQHSFSLFSSPPSRSSRLRGSMLHEKEETMTETAGVVVIGGGCIGTSIALHLAREGVRDVLLLERAYLCAGTTGQSGAIIRQHYSNDFTAAMARDCLTIFRNWGDTIGGGDPRFQEIGVLVTVGEADTAGLKANVAMQRRLGIETHLLAPSEVH